jgi:uncharacterized membrane protein YdjX (TVP38/TMEM64 family)
MGFYPKPLRIEHLLRWIERNLYKTPCAGIHHAPLTPGCFGSYLTKHGHSSRVLSAGLSIPLVLWAIVGKSRLQRCGSIWRFTFGLRRSGCGLAVQTLKRILSDRRFHRLAGGALLLGTGVLLLAWKMGVDGAAVRLAWKQAEGFLVLRPWLLFAGLVVLPAFPIPTSALLLLAGTVWRDRPVAACAICLLAIALNMSWTYWVAARPGRGLVVKLLTVMKIRVPELPEGNDLRVILLMRLTPGFPFFVQNYVLGFLRVPFRLYLPVSMGCNGMISVGVVLSAAGVADGNLVPILTGVALIIVGFVVVQWIKAKILKR